MQFLVLNGTHDSVDETPDLPSLKQLLPHLLDILKFLTFKWLAVVNIHCMGEAELVLMNLFRKKSHITLRSCLLALCFDPTTLFEIAVFLKAIYFIKGERGNLRAIIN